MTSTKADDDTTKPTFNNYGFPMIKDFPVAFCDLKGPDVIPPMTCYEGGPKPSKVILPEGHVKPSGFGCRPLPCEMIYDRDVRITLRDGTRIYLDVFRPVTEDLLPTIIAWSPYGKTGTGAQQYNRIGPFNCGVDPKIVSGYHQFEAPDPAEWTNRGYAVLNVDARGAFDSEGNIMSWGPQEALDIYDTIQWVTEQGWSNKAVTMAGNSWLAISQINAAARDPHPALKCIAPWEAQSDPYKDIIVRGGIPQVLFGMVLQSMLVGRGKMEDGAVMTMQHPYYDQYWKIKAVPLEKIDIPTYIVASYSTFIHTAGSIRTWREIKTDKKWLRIHNAQEWSDQYSQRNVDDLQKFFDYHLKGINNGWSITPPVRLTMISFHGKDKDVVERSEPEYPLKRQQLLRLDLNAATKTMTRSSNGDVAEASYDSHHLTNCLEFEWKVEQYTEIAGFPAVKLWAACKEKDDMDIHIQLRKKDANGKLLSHYNYTKDEGGAMVPFIDPTVYDFEHVNILQYLGPTGVLRASHAVTYNESKSTENEPHYDHDRSVPIPAGTIVPLKIGIWPTGMTLEKGESLVLRIAGHTLCLPEFKQMIADHPRDANEGRHLIYTGGEYDSHLLIPVIN